MLKVNNEFGNFDFGEALIYIEGEKHLFVKRAIVKNDTVIMEYKGRLYQVCVGTGIRYPYVPTNADIFAKDWQVNENSTT